MDDIKSELNSKGFCFFTKKDIPFFEEKQIEFAKITNSFANLPLDPYSIEENRFRRFQLAVLLPWIDLLIFKPISDYYQKETYNAEVNIPIRHFESLSSEEEKNTFLKELIKFDFSLTDFNKNFYFQPIEVGIHFIQLVAKNNLAGWATPNHLHKDGEPYTFVHLINKKNTIGGESVVADNNKKIITKKTLKNELDSFGFIDDKVYHHVTEINTKDKSENFGFRNVIIIDFTPMKRIID